MEADELLAQLSSAGERFGSAASSAGLQLAVPSCPGWTVGDLTEHLTRTFGRAAHAVRGRAPETFAWQQPADALKSFAEAFEDLLRILRTARDSSSGGAGQPSRQFWIRRMAHETTIHWLDIELAADTGMGKVGPVFAADGVDELIIAIAPSTFSAPAIAGAQTITLMPLDVNRAWSLTVGPAGIRSVQSATDRADLTVAGMASDLYRWVWNRAGDDEVCLGGNLALTDVWHRDFVVG